MSTLPSNVHSPKKLQDSLNSQSIPENFTVDVKTEVENSLLIERQKKEKFAASKAQKCKDITQNCKTNEVCKFFYKT